MSTAAPFRATCPACRRPFDTEVWRSLHVRRMPGAREELLARRFCVHACPHCGATCRLEPVVLYTDFDRFEWYALYPSWALDRYAGLAAQVEAGFRLNTLELAPPMVQAWSPSFQVRTCFGISSLREKVLAHELGLDDRALELWKVRILRALGRTLDPGIEMWLDHAEGDRILFEVADLPGPDDTVVVKILSAPRAGYDALVAESGASLAEWFPTSVVDWRSLLLPPGAPSPAPMEPSPSEPSLPEPGRPEPA